MRRVHRLRGPRVGIPMCLRGLVTVPIACTLLIAAAISPADAQGGLGRARNRHPPQGQQQQTGGESPASKEELGPGEYSFDGYQVVEAINRGEGRQALAYYEKVALEAEQQGNTLRAARALGAATTAAVRLGRYQKAIQAGTHALELFKAAREPSQQDLMAWASVHSQLGGGRPRGGGPERGPPGAEGGEQVAEHRPPRAARGQGHGRSTTV